MRLYLILLLLTAQCQSQELYPPNRPAPKSYFTVRTVTDGSFKISIGSAILSQDDTIEILRAVRLLDTKAKLVIETQRDWNGRWLMALSQFANRAGFQSDEIWFRFDPLETVGDIERKKQNKSEMATPRKPSD